MPYLEMKRIKKAFPGVVANDDVSFSVERSTIHALVGENGAGKSTLMKVLYGLYQPDSGEIFLDGHKVKISSPQDAIDLAIGMVHQEFQLVPSLTVAENIVLGHEPQKGIWVDKEQSYSLVHELSEKFGLHVDPTLPIREVSVGVQQRVEILKLLYRKAQLLILDEPTAVLTPQEVEGLFKILRQLVEQGHTIVFITHKLNEVMNLCQRATVLRQGKMVGQLEISKTNKSEIARLMVGQAVDKEIGERPPSGDEPRLVLEKVSALNDRRLPALRDIDLKVHAGEIVGIAGVEGNGQRELVDVLAGLRPCQGTIRLKGEDLVSQSTRQRREAGCAIIPESRKTQGLNSLGTVAENLAANLYYQPSFSRYGILALNKMTQYAKGLIKLFDIRTDGPGAIVDTLSGGNAQKLIIARELANQPAVLIAAHPTRGVDIAATQYVHQELLHMRAENVAVLLISADLDELFTLSDRILVLFEGEFIGEVDPKTVTYEQLGLLMTGHVG
jgi:simple sugar transport system ATP-binding protein